MGLELFDLSGKTAMVTGATRGLGEVCARAMAKAGADIAVCGRNAEDMERVSADIRDLGRRALGVFLDVTSSQSVAEAVEKIRSDLGPINTVVDVKKPTPSEQQALWADLLGDTADGSPFLLSGQFNLNVSTIKKIVKRVSDEPRDNGHTLHDRLWETCLVSTGPRLDQLTQQLEPKATWDDIVLPKEAKDLLQQIADQVRQRSKVYDSWGFRQKMNRRGKGE